MKWFCEVLITVSFSPRPWIDVFDLPEKSNMAVTESDPDRMVRKMSITFLMTSELSMRAWNWNVTDSKKTIFDLIIFQRYFPIWQSKEMSHDFVGGQSVAENLKPVSATEDMKS